MPQAINKGTITPFQNINIGSSTSAFNLTSNQINYKGTSWNNVVSTTSTTFSNTSGFTTSYTKLGISATILARNLTSRFKITFNLSALYFGVGTTNHCYTIGTTINSVDVLDIVGGTALIGIGIIEQSTNNFSSGCLTFLQMLLVHTLALYKI